MMSDGAVAVGGVKVGTRQTVAMVRPVDERRVCRPPSCSESARFPEDEAEVFLVPGDEFSIYATCSSHSCELIENTVEDSWNLLFDEPLFACVIEIQSSQHIGSYPLLPK